MEDFAHDDRGPRATEESMDLRDRYRLLFEHSLDAVLLNYVDGTIFAANPAACRMFGRSAEEICRVGRAGILDPTDSRGPAFRAERDRTGSAHGELWMLRADASRFPAEVSSVLYTDAQGRHVSSMIVRDLTESKRTRATEARLAAIVASSLEAIAGVTLDDKIISWNPAAERLLGYSAEEVIGRPWHFLLPADKVHERNNVLLHLDGDISHQFVTQRRHKDGSIIDVAITVSPIRADGEVLGVSACLRDARDMLERERLQQEKIEALELADRMKEDFVGVISHELRTPLNFIMGFASILEDGLAGSLNEQQLSYLGKILDGSERMLRLVNDLLDSSRMIAGKFSLTPTETQLDPILRLAISSIQPLSASRDIHLTWEDGDEALVEMDTQRITQVLIILLDNAVKFTPPGGSIHLSTRRAQETLVVEVRDSGAGIDPDDIPRLFKRFSQLDMSSTRQVGGAGLGLSIAKGIVEAHEGQIGVRSEGRGKGSTFWFTLPLAS